MTIGAKWRAKIGALYEELRGRRSGEKVGEGEWSELGLNNGREKGLRWTWRRRSCRYGRVWALERREQATVVE